MGSKSRLKRIVKKSEVIGNKVFGYHATDKNNLESIMEQGIKPSRDGYVYLAPSEEISKQHVQHYDEIVILKVQLNNRDIEEIKTNNDYFNFYEFAEQYFYDNFYNGEDFQIEIGEELPIDDYDDFELFWNDLEEVFPEYYEVWDKEVLQAFFNETELDLMIPYTIPSNRIVEVK